MEDDIILQSGVVAVHFRSRPALGRSTLVYQVRSPRLAKLGRWHEDLADAKAEFDAECAFYNGEGEPAE